MKYDFAKKVDELLVTQRRTKKSLYDRLGMTGNGFDAMMKNNTFSATRLGEIADFFGIQVAAMYGETMNSQTVEKVKADGDSYLQEHLATLEQNFEKLLEQLTVKDTQIAGLQESQRNLQDMLKLVLGKSRSVTFTQLSDVDDIFGNRYDSYKDAGANLITNLLSSSAPSVSQLHT